MWRGSQEKEDLLISLKERNGVWGLEKKALDCSQ